MSTSSNSINRQIGAATTNDLLSHLRASSGQWDNYNDQTDVHGYYSGVGSPEGVVAADIGSIYSDTGAGATGVYYKTTDTVNTGWVLNSMATTGAAFLAYLAAVNDLNVTGAGTIYAFGNNTGLTEVFDQGGNFTPGPVAGGAFFTAPSDGIYHFDATIALTGVSAAMNRSVILLNVNGSDDYSFEQINPTGGGFANQNVALVGAIAVSLTAGDLVRLRLVVYGGAGDTCAIAGVPGTIRQSWWSGYQVSASVLSGAFSVVSQTFTANGTYTPTVGMQYCEVEIVGGGGAGGGAPATAAAQTSGGGGGGSGEFAYGIFDAATIGVSQAVTIGAAGAGASGAAGGTGGTTSVGALITAVGGVGGSATLFAVPGISDGGLGGTGGAGGNYRYAGSTGSPAFGGFTTAFTAVGGGGNSSFGSGGRAGVSGGVGLGRGAGGSGVANPQSTAAATGFAGSAGFVKITEYVIV